MDILYVHIFGCVLVSAEIYCWGHGKICQVVGPIKDRSPLLTLRACWFLTKGEGGVISWLKTKQWWMKWQGCCSACLAPLHFKVSQLFFPPNFHFIQLEFKETSSKLVDRLLWRELKLTASIQPWPFSCFWSTKMRQKKISGVHYSNKYMIKGMLITLRLNFSF